MGDHILLVGMMGAGKTTVGRKLAARLARPFLDSDEQVAAATGRSVTEILRTDGISAFRHEESAALERAVASPEPAVIAVAGGAVLDPANRRVIGRAGTVVWLRAELTTLAERVGDASDRPLLTGDPPGNLERLYEERRPLYEEVAGIVVDVDGLGAGEVANQIADVL